MQGRAAKKVQRALILAGTVSFIGIYPINATEPAPARPLAPQPSENSQSPGEKPVVPGAPAAPPSLSKQLDESEGVVTPPAGVDAEIRKPTPGDFSSDMPVIVPPGEPGGDQKVQPK